MEPFKFPSIKELYYGQYIRGDNVYVYEKVDGGNVSIRRDGNKIIPCSRGGPIGNNNKYFFSQFKQFVYQDICQNLYDLPEDFALFAEFTHKGYGHIDYDQQHQNKLFSIGIYNVTEQQFLHPIEVEEWIDLLNLRDNISQVPLLSHGEVSKTMVTELVKQSKLYQGPAEGLVIHTYGKQFKNGVKMRKFYHPDFSEIDNTKEGVRQYTTLRRIIKAGQKLMITSKGVDLSSIVRETAKDIAQEVGTQYSRERIIHAIHLRDEDIRNRVIPLF